MSDRFVFSTEAWPERDRFAAWCEGVVRRYARLDLTTTQDQSRFRATIEARRIGAVDIAHWFMTPVSVVRTPSLMRDGDDTLYVALINRGAGYQTQREDDQKISPGDAVVCDCACSGAIIAATDMERTLVKVPRDKVAALLPGAKRFGGARLDRDPEARRLLLHYVNGTFDAELNPDGAIARLAEDHIAGLIALALGAEGEARHLVEHHNDVRAVRRAAILHDIGTSLFDPKLAAPAVAARLGITPRYLRKLLEETGKSFSEHLLDKRLERAAALLRDPQRRGARIATIAYECGFGDLSYFNRAFRRRFGLTPSDMRAAALDDVG